MPENEMQRAQRIADEVMTDPAWRWRDVTEQYAEMKRRMFLQPEMQDHTNRSTT